jgi:hypothetical protein
MKPDFPIKIAKEIYAHWEEYARYWPNCKPSRRPSLSVLGEILNTCFFASLRQEEGRPTQFNLVLCRSDKLSNPAFRYSKYTKTFNLMRFESPRVFSASELVRLAPACEPEKTLLLVSQVENKAGLHLWGIVDVGKEPCTSHELQVRVFGPGELKITLHDRTLCSYKNGEVLFPERTLVNSGHSYKSFAVRIVEPRGKRGLPLKATGLGISAFEFCFRNQPSVAIVVSQDGGIKTVTRVGKHVYFWENVFFDASTEI